MALRKIREQGDEILRKKSREVNIDDITAEKKSKLNRRYVRDNVSF